MVTRIFYLLCIFVANPVQSAVSSPDGAVDSQTITMPAVNQNTLFAKKPLVAPVQSGSDSLSNLIQVSFGLFVVIVLIVAIAWFTRRFGNLQVAAKGNLRIVGGLPLGARERVVLIQVGSEQIVLGVAPGRVEKIHVLENLIPIEESHSLSKNSFAIKLSEVIKGYKGK